MTNQPLTPEQLADSTDFEGLALDILWRPTEEWYVPSEIKYEVLKNLIINAIQAATEPLQREIEILASERDNLANTWKDTQLKRITQLESDKAALSAELRNYNAYNTVLLNLSQSAQERDARLIEEGRQVGLDEAELALENIAPNSYESMQTWKARFLSVIKRLKQKGE